jgi:signal transduction histidine kinase
MTINVPSPATTAPADATPATRAGWRQLPRDLVYLLLGFPIGVAAFVAAVVGLSVGAGTLIIWVGIPILVATLGIARGFAEVERVRIRACEGRPLPSTYYRTGSGNLLRRLLTVLGDPQYWKDIAHALVSFPVRIVTWAVTVAWVASAVGGITYIAWGWAVERHPENESLWNLLGIESEVAGVLLYVATGLLFLLTMPYVARGAALVDVTLGRLLLTNPGAAENAALRARAEQLQLSRAAAAQAEATTLRKVERDIHDGPQQRLVRTTMDLEAAQRRMDDDPDAARPLVQEALAQTQEALAELRALSRGVAPPILADRGLEAALTAAAARCPVPVDLEVALGGDDRLPESAENTAYFTVTEALTNVAKHSGASAVSVSVVRVADTLHVQVDDDGIGGAHVGKGHGLAGLADRLAGIDGTLDVHSPPGGGTIVSAQIPVR